MLDIFSHSKNLIKRKNYKTFYLCCCYVVFMCVYLCICTSVFRNLSRHSEKLETVDSQSSAYRVQLHLSHCELCQWKKDSWQVTRESVRLFSVSCVSKCIYHTHMQNMQRTVVANEICICPIPSGILYSWIISFNIQTVFYKDCILLSATFYSLKSYYK